MYDVIVVGTRVAGAATAMLLARRGVRVLALDRARFPSDTLSTHQIQVPGTARLRRWGLLDPLLAAGTPATRQLRVDVDGVVLHGAFPTYDGADAIVSPRRTVLDAMLVDAARAAGAEVREGVRVESLVRDGDRVVGVRVDGRVERAALVVGADGKHSTVAAQVGATVYRQRPATTFASYGYWSDAPLVDGELYLRHGFAAAAFPTNDGLTMAFVTARLDAFTAARADLEQHYVARLDECGDLGARLRTGARVERLRTTPDLPNGFRTASGPGWALVGDAGVVMDPVSAQGITNAFRDAELLVDAIVDPGKAVERCASIEDGGSLVGSGSAGRLRAYGRRRDRAVRSMYRFTLGLAELAPTARDRRLATVAAGRPREVSRLLGVFAGIVPPSRALTLRGAARFLLR